MAHITAISTYVGPIKNMFGSVIDPKNNEIAMAIKVATHITRNFPVDSFNSIVFGHSGIRQIFPSGAAAVAQELGISCQTFDITAGCTSMNVGVEIASHANGSVLVIGSDNLSRTIDPINSTHVPLQSFADGAAALIVQNHSNSGFEILACEGTTASNWRDFYTSKDGIVSRSVPENKKKDISDTYLTCWLEITRKLLKSCPLGTVPWIFANQGDKKLFPKLIRLLELPEDHIIITDHGHAGGADAWIALNNTILPKNSIAIILSSGIGFHFHGILLKVS